MSSSQYYIPDLLVTWPWQRILNPALAEVKDDSNAWVESLALFEQAQLQKFNACDFSMFSYSFLILVVRILQVADRLFLQISWQL